MTDSAQDLITERANTIISEKFGIFHSPDNLRNLHRSLLHTARELGFEKDLGLLTGLIEKNELTESQQEVLVSNLTVGETFFFRDMHTLNVFRDHVVLPLLDLRRNSSKSLRFWSAGCCSGEEPYTLAIMLTELLDDLSEWDIRIFASDLNERFLEKAEKGVYTSWSFRNTRKEIIDKYFIKSGNTYELLPSIRRMVTFHSLNLAGDASPELIPHLINQDAIFCRNVLMYFSPEKSAKITSRFYASLAENGWLILSPVEASLPVISAFTSVCLNGITLYQKQLNQAPRPDQRPIAIHPPVKHTYTHPATEHLKKTLYKSPERVPPKPAVTDPAIIAVTEYNNGDYEKAIVSISAILGKDPAKHDLIFLLIRSYANLGQLQQARQWSEKFITLDKTRPGLHYLHAVILHEMDLQAEAEDALRKALYLEPTHILSHFLMGSILARLGKESKARKHFKNVYELLSSYKDDAVIPESEGMTAGRMKEIVHSMQ